MVGCLHQWRKNIAVFSSCGARPVQPRSETSSKKFFPRFERKKVYLRGRRGKPEYWGSKNLSGKEPVCSGAGDWGGGEESVQKKRIGVSDLVAYIRVDGRCVTLSSQWRRWRWWKRKLNNLSPVRYILEEDSRSARAGRRSIGALFFFFLFTLSHPWRPTGWSRGSGRKITLDRPVVGINCIAGRQEPRRNLTGMKKTEEWRKSQHNCVRSGDKKKPIE